MSEYNVSNQEKDELEFYRYFMHHKGLEFECAFEFIKWKEKRKKRKTYLQDFLEKFPNAKREMGGTAPEVCRDLVYGITSDCDGISCAECWNKECKEDEE